MKTLIKPILVICLLNFFQCQIKACTCFAVYSEDIWYGMNFDYPDTDIKFLIGTIGDKKVFRALFGASEGYIAGMNANGLFTNYQLLYYNNGEPTSGVSNTLSLGDLNYYSINYLSTISEVTDYIDDRLLVPSWGQNLHTLFADTTKNAIVAEPFGSVNGITTVQNSFLVMTNFPNYDFIGDDYTDVYGVGSERYITAYSYIQDHISGFGYDDGFETLSRTVQTNGDYLTQISLLYDPVKMEIFFCLDHDFTKIWKVSFENETLETYSGFSSHITHTLNASGIWASDLLNDVTGTEDQDLLNPDNTIYPNPSSGQFNINLSSLPVQNARVEIFNSSGELVYRSLFQNTPYISIDLTDYPKGVYRVSVLYDTRLITGHLCLE